MSIREQIHDVLKTHKNLIGLDADERAKELLSLVGEMYDPERAKNLMKKASYSDIEIILKNSYQNSPP